MLNKIALLGGTFDPVHLGHLRLALDIKHAMEMDHVFLLPCHRPPHREPTIASTEHRLAMLKLAITSEPSLAIDDRELSRPGPSYTIDTLMSLRQDYPNDSLSLIMGSDVFLKLNQWHDWEKLLDYCHIIVAQRPNYSISAHSAVQKKLSTHFTQHKNELQNTPFGKIFFQSVRPLDISATEIRTHYREGENNHYLLPDAVYAYINKHHVYPQGQKHA